MKTKPTRIRELLRSGYFYCHDCSRYTVPEKMKARDTAPMTCGQCGSEYLCDNCAAFIGECLNGCQDA